VEEATRTTETDVDTNNRGWSAPSEHRTAYRLAPGTGPHYLEETHEDSYALTRSQWSSGSSAFTPTVGRQQCKLSVSIPAVVTGYHENTPLQRIYIYTSNSLVWCRDLDVNQSTECKNRFLWSMVSTANTTSPLQPACVQSQGTPPQWLNTNVRNHPITSSWAVWPYCKSWRGTGPS